MSDNKNKSLVFMDQVVNKISPSFCGAKWYNATIWLGSGSTTSCHHPPSHKINPAEVENDYKAIHNTTYKKLVRKQMLEGVRPKECEYCWKVEDMDKNAVSDRFYKSAIYTTEDLQAAGKIPWNQSVDLKTLEIAFDNNCNFACSYCNASFSTTWGHDINTSGPYQNLVSDGAGAYGHAGEWAHPYGLKNTNNPFTAAFWKWWENELQYSSNELRVTGGEATVNNDFWKLVDWFEKNPDCNVKLSINSNLGIKEDKLNKLIQASTKIKNFSINTSNESIGAHAEYIRDGLNYEQWDRNIHRLLTEGKLGYFHNMFTITSICLKSITDEMEHMINLRKQYPHVYISFDLNILRFPSFMSVTTLPVEIKQERKLALIDWKNKNNDDLTDHERDNIDRLISYLETVEEGFSWSAKLEDRCADFKSFYEQYDIRRGKNFRKTFADWPELIAWYDTLVPKPKQNTRVKGDADDWGYHMYKEIMEQAEDEGLI